MINEDSSDATESVNRNKTFSNETLSDNRRVVSRFTFYCMWYPIHGIDLGNGNAISPNNYSRRPVNFFVCIGSSRDFRSTARLAIRSSPATLLAAFRLWFGVPSKRAAVLNQWTLVGPCVFIIPRRGHPFSHAFSVSVESSLVTSHTAPSRRIPAAAPNAVHILMRSVSSRLR